MTWRASRVGKAEPLYIVLRLRFKLSTDATHLDA